MHYSKTKFPTLALCYDFDRTLTPDDMQAQGYIQDIGWNIDKFWAEANAIAKANNMDQTLAYMYKMLEEAQGHFYPTKEVLAGYGAKVKLYPGVEEWFKRINAYGEKRDICIEHYIISSGLQEMIEGTVMAKNGDFKRIYASSFYYNEKGIPVWPAQVVNFTGKTQFLFRIEKGALDVNDRNVNEYYPPEELRVPFRNMVYIGDSDTDIPCMKLVNSQGGHAIGVYDPDTGDRTKVQKMMRDDRIRYFAPADYTEGSELDTLVKQIIDSTYCNERLVKKHNEQMKAEG